MEVDKIDKALIIGNAVFAFAVFVWLVLEALL